MTPLEQLVAACDSLAADGRYALKTRALAKALKSFAIQDRGANMAEQAIFSETKVLGDADILTLPSKPVEVVPAPGAGKAIRWLSAHLKFDTSDGAYVFDQGATWQLLVGSQEDSGLVSPLLGVGEEEGEHLFLVPPFYGIGAGGFGGYLTTSEKFLAGYVDQPLMIADVYNGVSDYTGGGAANTLAVTVIYTIVDLT